MIYCFQCVASKHPEGQDRSFVQMVTHVSEKRIDQYPCPVCGGLGKRDLAKEIPTIRSVGMTPISNGTALGKELEFSFGRFKKNPDGTVNTNHAAFRDTGELSKYMNGNNDLGEPELNQRTGEPLRRKDGSVVRKGAKLFKYGKNATPRRSSVRRRNEVPSAWIDEKTANVAHGAIPRSTLGVR